MPVYEYTALTTKGKTSTGVIDAESAAAARQKLRNSGIYPTSVKEVRETAGQSKKTSWIEGMSRSFARVRPTQVAMMTRQLATLVGAGFPLVSAIDTLIPQAGSHVFKKTLSKIKDSIVEGNSFASTLSLYPNIFSPVYINMVSAGESSGTLEIVLDRLADITEKQQALKNRIRAALAYPILMSMIGVSVLFFLLTFIVPTIAGIFKEMNQVLPAPTRFLIATGSLMKSYWWVLFILIALFLIGIRYVNRTVKGRYFFDKLTLSLPGFGVLARKLAVARFARTLGSLLENGVTMMAALEIVKNIVGNVLLADAVSEAAKAVGKGQGLGVSLAESELFPSLSIQMIQVGEQSGALEAMLNKIADVFENEVESTVMSMTSVLEPLMILIMGVVVGFIVLSICLPIFEMNQLVK
ncbi:MAG: type II secretion system protein GspF [Desulfobacteraceae bacterium IS3]|nr:MAG: type II secretion system protein GspF [Desulfobacteraceae bacterium IS3]HAO23453.1 type II secretion system protein GspF [Desulfobacteraceae bacterium]